MKKHSMFYKIFVPFFVLGVVLVTGFSLYIYRNTFDSIEANYISNKAEYLQQVKNNVEKKVRTIEYAFTAYGSTSSFNEIFSNRLTSADFEVYRDINTELKYIEMMVMDESTYDLISLAGGWGIIKGSLIQLSDGQIDLLKDKYSRAETSLFWSREEDNIEMTISLPMFSKEKCAIGRAQISQQSLKKLIDNQSGDYISIFGQHEVLFENEKNKISPEVVAEYDKKLERDPLVIEENSQSKMIFLKSDYNNWVYAMTLNSEGTVHATRYLRLGLISASGVLIIFIGVIAYFFAKRFMAPIRQLQQDLNFLPQGFKGDELDMVAYSVTTLVNQNEYLSASLISQKPQLETLFILSLFRNSVMKNEVNQRLSQFGYHFEDKRFYIGIIQIDDLDEQHGGERELLLLAINNIVSEIVPEEKRMLPIVLNDEMQATVFVMEKEDTEASKKVTRYFEEVQAGVEKYLKLSISAGISANFFDLLESKKALDFAKEAVYYRHNTGPNSIIFYKDIVPSSSKKTLIKYPLERQNQLFDAIRSGSEETNRHLNRLVDEIFRLNQNMTGLEVSFTRLINELVQLGLLMGADAKDFEDVKQVYLKVLTSYNAKEIKEVLLKKLIEPISNNPQERAELEFKSISDSIIHLIQTEFDQDLSLENIAEKLHYNPNYLSSVFKKESGENLGDYIQNYRLSIAKKWLKETDMTVKEIAEKLQYKNPQNFIRFFKKKMSITPGEYRKKNKNLEIGNSVYRERN